MWTPWKRKERLRIVYGEKVAVFPVETSAGIVWMTGRDDLSWENAYIVWCLPRRLGNLLKHTAMTWVNTDPNRGRDMVHEGMTRTSREHPMQVGCLHVSYVPSDILPAFRDELEGRGIYGPTIRVMSGFMDGMHRTAWLMAHGAPFIPLMTTNLHECSALELHAGAGFSHIRLGDF